MLERAALLFDVREIGEYTEIRLPDAVNLPASEIIGRWREISTDGDVVIYCRSGHRSGLGVNMLRRAGYANIYNMDGGIRAWFATGLPVDTAHIELVPSSKIALFEEIGVQEALQRLERGETVVDVRNADEFKSGHIPGAVNIPMDDLSDSLSRLRDYRSLMLICDTGIRSDIAAAYLHSQGFKEIANIKQGIVAWRRLNQPWTLD